nr:rubrerythrin family protein [Actinomycetota bacterium]
MDRVVGKADVQRWRRNFRDEVDGAAIYRAMADGEPNAGLAQVYRRLGAAEARHAQFWVGRLRRHGARVPPARPSVRA